MPKQRPKHAKTLRRNHRRALTFTLPAGAVAAVASMSLGIALWPHDAEPHPTALPPVHSTDGFEREAPLGRGGDGRTPEPTSPTSPTVTATPDSSETPTETPTATDTPEPTKTTDPEPTQEPEPGPTPVGQMYVTAGLNVRTAPSEDADVITVLAPGTQVDVTENTDGAWVQIIYDGTVAWVSGDYLSETEPQEDSGEGEESGQPESGHGISDAPCDSGSSVESGLTPDAIRVHRAVCAEFPDVSSYGGLRSGGGAHSEGRALDIMVSSSSLGEAIAAWVRENHELLGVSEVIWAQRIWTVERSSEGWRPMADRGSTTANHYDHVHVTVYG